MKKKCAVFTIVKDEKFFLPIWLKHYKKYFSNEDIYILDHQSSDGSTENLDVNVQVVTNQVTFDHHWLLSVVKYYQRELLKKYEAVLFVEVDEIVYSIENPLSETIEEFIKSGLEYVTCNGHEVYHRFDVEPSLIDGENILANRNWWFYSNAYDKTLLSKVPIQWYTGFHQESQPKYRKADLYLLHLHRLDWEVLTKRHEERASWKKSMDGLGDYNKVSEREKVLEWYKDISNPLTEIEQRHKDALSHL